jgi:hypothetical protein
MATHRPPLTIATHLRHLLIPRSTAMSRHVPNTLRRVIALAALPALAASILVAAPVAARTPVDPNTLNPAPPDFFNATCYEGAAGVICDLAFVDPESPWIDEPSGILCGSTELLFSQTRSVAGKRFYDADGNLLQRHFREFMEGTLTNPDTGRSVPWTQHDTQLQNLTIPGDVDSGLIKITGLATKVYLSGGGVVQMNAGTFLQNPVTGEIAHEGGPHPFNDYFIRGDASALQPICDALE